LVYFPKNFARRRRGPAEVIVSLVSPDRAEVENVANGRPSRTPTETSKLFSQVIYRPIGFDFEVLEPWLRPLHLGSLFLNFGLLTENWRWLSGDVH
jgi:hypothetical protein